MQNVNSLSFDELRRNFAQMLMDANPPVLMDVNYRGSGISLLMDLLAYNTHYIGYYTKMMLDENFIDSARLKSSMLAHAKLVGYTPKNHRSARVELFVTKTMLIESEPESKKILVPAGHVFSSNTTADAADALRKTFVTIDDFYLTVREVFEEMATDGAVRTFVRYKNENSPVTPIIAYEGVLGKWDWIVPSGVLGKRFVIKRKGVDLDTLRVKVYDTPDSATYTIFTRADLSPTVDGKSNVFFVTANTDGYYELYFGNDIFGKSVGVGNKVAATFVVSSGSSGNGVGQEFGRPAEWNLGADNNGNPYKLDSSYPAPISSGGTDEETIEDLRFNIPHHFKRQGRIVTKDDYKSIILSEYRNVDAINVWGGEEAIFKEYGKVFISVKPKHSQSLSFNAKQELQRNVLSKHSILGSDVIFVDPEFIYVDHNVFIKFDPNKTDKTRGHLASLVFDAAKEYEAQYLNRFQSILSEVDFLSFIKAKDKGIVSIYTEKALRKHIKLRYDNPMEMVVVFGNPIKPNSVKTEVFSYGLKDVVISASQELLYIVDATTGERIVSASIGSVDYKRGVLRMKLPTVGIRMKGAADNGYEGLLGLTVVPVAPDIESSTNNILRIGEFKEVTVNE